jgi:hypothetical protein
VNRAIFELVKASFFIELARMGPPIDLIYKWREEAWTSALARLASQPP